MYLLCLFAMIAHFYLQTGLLAILTLDLAMQQAGWIGHGYAHGRGKATEWIQPKLVARKAQHASCLHQSFGHRYGHRQRSDLPPLSHYAQVQLSSPSSADRTVGERERNFLSMRKVDFQIKFFLEDFPSHRHVGRKHCRHSREWLKEMRMRDDTTIDSLRRLNCQMKRPLAMADGMARSLSSNGT